jgi:hypothetical protein
MKTTNEAARRMADHGAVNGAVILPGTPSEKIPSRHAIVSGLGCRIFAIEVGEHRVVRRQLGPRGPRILCSSRFRRCVADQIWRL